jgi:hypothetical protein
MILAIHLPGIVMDSRFRGNDVVFECPRRGWTPAFAGVTDSEREGISATESREDRPSRESGNPLCRLDSLSCAIDNRLGPVRLNLPAGWH